MDAADKSQKGPRKDCKYNAQELEQIVPFKEIFIKAKTIPERLLILKSLILPAMFNYWVTSGKEPKDEEESQSWAKALTIWCSNNWRMQRGLARKSNNFRPRRADVLWRNRKEDVLKAIAEELGIAEATTQTKGWFEARMPAIKKMIAKMSPEEREKLDAEVAEEAGKGYDEKDQKRLAEKNHKKRVYQAIKDQYMEMGMTSIVFVCYTRVDGKMVVDAFDHTPELMGISSANFTATYPDEVMNMKLLILNYMKVLRTRKTLPELPFGIGNDPGQPKIHLQNTPAGYPILPIPLPSEKWGKKDWENLFTIYLGRHYELATGGKTAHLPYKEMDKKQKVFIENKYLPKKAKIKQPRNLTKSAIAEIFDHITKRQEKYGPSEAFKFKNIKMKGDIQPTQYPDPKSVAAHPPTADRNADADADTAICEDDTIDKAGNMTVPPPPGNTEDVADADAGVNITPHEHYNAAGLYSIPKCSAVTFVIIDEALAKTFNRVGWPLPIPCNGPNEGFPLYPVPCNVYNGLMKYLASKKKAVNQTPIIPSPTEATNIDPALLHLQAMPTPRPTPPPQLGPNAR